MNSRMPDGWGRFNISNRGVIVSAGGGPSPSIGGGVAGGPAPILSKNHAASKGLLIKEGKGKTDLILTVAF